ncbi:hypothetical protein RF11_14976 [Thelohanellus kitauei]|nr:hypothetical protein RF11_14976 [Thelohanellus kitauei]
MIKIEPDDLNIINMFYFIGSYSWEVSIRDKYMYFYKTHGLKFRLPDVVQTERTFEGMNNFLFSEAFSSLMMSILVEWKGVDSRYQKTEMIHNLLLISMILCLMMKIPVNKNNYITCHKAVDFIFGIRKDLGNINVITLLALLKNRVNNDLYDSILEYLMEISQVPQDFFSGISQNFSDMINLSKQCLDLALENFQNKSQEIFKSKEKTQGDLKNQG